MTNRLEIPPHVAWPARNADGIFLQPVGPVLVRGRILSPADALGWRRLPVPGLPAQARGDRRRGGSVTSRWNVGAVLLDMDGTLLDTEKVYFESLIAALNSLGYTDDVVPLCHAMIGLPGPECETLLKALWRGFSACRDHRAFIANRTGNS